MLRYKSMGIEDKKKIWRVMVRERARKSDRLDKVTPARKTGGRMTAELQVAPKRQGRARSGMAISKQCAKGSSLGKAELLRSLIQKRAKGWPLQYGLGTEYFGDLELECRPGVLIPRSANT
jgi:methylase of polypeptide subunit release factors